MSFTEQHKAQLDTFWFLLQVCGNLTAAVVKGDVNTVKILSKCTRENCITGINRQNKPLIFAAILGRVEILWVLLEYGAKAERANVGEHTVLYYAAMFGLTDMCRLLLDWGVKVDPLDNHKDTPLHEAARGGHLSVVKLLVERGADVSVKNNSGETASDMARIWGKEAVAEWLDSVIRG
jgi:ankyrin repeat protein